MKMIVMIRGDQNNTIDLVPYKFIDIAPTFAFQFDDKDLLEYQSNVGAASRNDKMTKS